MIRIAVAFPGKTGRQTLCRALEMRGLAPRFRCHTGAEAIRAVKTMGGGVVVCGARLSDMTAGEVAEALAGEGVVIAVGHAAQLAACGVGAKTAFCCLIFSVFHWPCATTLQAIRRETGSLRWTLLSAALPTAVGVLLCLLVSWLVP